MVGLNIAQIKDIARNKGINLSDSQADSILKQAWDQGQYGADSGKVNSILSGMGSSSRNTNTSTTTSADDMVRGIMEEINKQADEYIKRSKEFDTNNPFSFDEILATKSAEEPYNPYYDAELKDYMSGVERQRGSLKDERELLLDLNRITTGAEQRNLDEAIRASEEGYAGQGLFFSGSKERETGLKQIEGNEAALKREKQLDYNLGQFGRQEQELEAGANTFKRRLGAEKTTAIQTDVASQKAEEQARRQMEKQEFIGYPYYNQSSNAMNQLYQYL